MYNTSTEVNAENMSFLVSKAFEECQFKDSEDIIDYDLVQGIYQLICFNSKRLKEHKNLIKTILEELPDKFKKGDCFYNLSYNKDGVQWTNSKIVCDQLVCLGLGLKLIEYCLPKEMWFKFTDGIPYVRLLGGKNGSHY